MSQIESQRIKKKLPFHIKYLERGLPCGDCPLATAGYTAGYAHAGCLLGGMHWVSYGLARHCVVPTGMDTLMEAFPQLAVLVMGNITSAVQALDALQSAYVDSVCPKPPDPPG